MKQNPRIVQKLIEKEVFIEGPIKVRSGQELPLYCNLKKAFGFPEIAKEIAKQIAAEIPKNTDCIAVMGFGGLPLGALVSQEAGLPVIYIRDKIKEHGTKSELEGYLPRKEDRIVLLDDVYTSGSSIISSMEILEKYNLKIIKAIVFLTWNEPNIRVPIKYLYKGHDIII